MQLRKEERAGTIARKPAARIWEMRTTPESDTPFPRKKTAASGKCGTTHELDTPFTAVPLILMYR